MTLPSQMMAGLASPEHGPARPPRTAFQIRAIPPEVLGRLRQRDDAGNPPRPVDDEEGGSPLRCCLRSSRPGERMVLVSYAPLRWWAKETGADPGPYEETGPVFIHPGPCPGPAGAGYPAEFTGRSRVFRAYSAQGRILGGQLVTGDEAADPASAAAALAAMFADPRVALVHVRAVEFGCFTFEARRG